MQDVQQATIKNVVQVYQQIPPSVVCNDRKIATRIQKVKGKVHLTFTVYVIHAQVYSLH